MITRLLWVLCCLGLLPAWGCLSEVNHDGILTVACLGDSNTQRDWPTVGTVRWCENASALLTSSSVTENGTFKTEPVVWNNWGVGGATVCDPGIVWSWGMTQLAQAATADVLILAFGTNDILRLHKTPAEIVACYQAVTTAAGVRSVFVALSPPVLGQYAGSESQIEAMNAAIVAAIPANHVIDFFSGMTPELYIDELHLNDTGQALRAQRAVTALKQ